MARFVGQPEGLGPFLSAAALVVVHLEPPAASETSTGPGVRGIFLYTCYQINNH